MQQSLSTSLGGPNLCAVLPAPAAPAKDKPATGTKAKQTTRGNLEFQYRAADINLKSESMTWYTVSNNKAIFQGLAIIHGFGTFTFRVHSTDGGQSRSDQFDIRIWSGTDTEANPIHRAKNEVGWGNIVVHRHKTKVVGGGGLAFLVALGSQTRLLNLKLIGVRETSRSKAIVGR